jgi:hypothetical protein
LLLHVRPTIPAIGRGVANHDSTPPAKSGQRHGASGGGSQRRPRRRAGPPGAAQEYDDGCRGQPFATPMAKWISDISIKRSSAANW